MFCSVDGRCEGFSFLYFFIHSFKDEDVGVDSHTDWKDNRSDSTKWKCIINELDNGKENGEVEDDSKCSYYSFPPSIDKEDIEDDG